MARGVDRLTEHETLAERLREPARFPHETDRVEVIETHISTVVLAGVYAYKLKKPLDLGFLDFSTLERRRDACDEELRLNGRLAPQIYLDRVAITGTPDDPRIDGSGPVIEWAVRMRRFDDDRLFERLVERGELDVALVEQLAERVADFHAGAAVAAADGPWADPEAVAGPVRDNFSDLGRLLPGNSALGGIEAWTKERLRALRPLLAERGREGFIRECHGDLHLGNIVEIDGEPVIFDGIEFSPALRWIDIMNENAFLSMDLRSRGRPDLAAHYISAVLERSGDYAGAALLVFYRVYRALVRAKVRAIRAANRDEAAGDDPEVQRYLAVAAAETRAPGPRLVVMHGLSGSGKSTVAHALIGRLDAVRVRSDVERKRLQGLAAHARTDSGVGTGLYDRDRSEETYQRLEACAAELLAAGISVVVDAATLRRAERERFRTFAGQSGIPFTVVDCVAPEGVLRDRIRARETAGGDPSEADTRVLDYQLGVVEPPEHDGADDVVQLDTAADPEFRSLAGRFPEWGHGRRA